MFLDVTGDAAVSKNERSSIEAFVATLPGSDDGEKSPDFYSQDHPWFAARCKEGNDGVITTSGQWDRRQRR